MDNIWIKSDKQCSLFWSNIAYFTPNMTFSGVETFDWHKSSSFEIRNSLYVSQWGESDAFTSCDHVNSQISISIQTYNWSQTSQRLHHLKVSFWQFLNFAGLFGVWISLWLYHTQSQKLMFFNTKYSSENYIHRYPSIYLFLKIEGLLLQMKYAEYCRNPQNLYLLRVTPVCLNLMMSFAVWLVNFAVYVNCGSQVTLCRSVLCRECPQFRSFHWLPRKEKNQQINVERSLFKQEVPDVWSAHLLSVRLMFQSITGKGKGLFK